MAASSLDLWFPYNRGTIPEKNKRLITFPPNDTPGIAPVDFYGSTMAIFEFLKGTHRISSMQGLRWETIRTSPKNNCRKIIGLAFSHEYNGKLPLEKDIQTVKEFFECTDSRLGWYLRSYKGYWTRI